MEAIAIVALIVVVVGVLIVTHKNPRRDVENSDRPAGGSLDGTREQ